VITAVLLLSGRAVLNYVTMVPDLCLYCAWRMPANPRAFIDRFGAGISFIIWIVIFTNRVVGLYTGHTTDSSRSYVCRLLASHLQISQPLAARDLIIKKLKDTEADNDRSTTLRGKIDIFYYYVKLALVDLKGSIIWDLIWLSAITAMGAMFVLFRWVKAPNWNLPQGETVLVIKPAALGFGQIVTLLTLLLPIFTVFLALQGRFFKAYRLHSV
jgi:hypothetical protein